MTVRSEEALDLVENAYDVILLLQTVLMGSASAGRMSRGQTVTNARRDSLAWDLIRTRAAQNAGAQGSPHNAARHNCIGPHSGCRSRTTDTALK